MATADKMMEGKLQIHFKIHKKVNFGKAVYVVGNIPELGLWKINFSLRLSWNQEHYWSGYLTIFHPIWASVIEFKYVVGNWENPQIGTLEWEAGEVNRKIDLQVPKNCVICQNSWNMDKITLILMAPELSNGSFYNVIGSCRELGGWKKLIRLEERENTKNAELTNEGKVENKEYFTTVEIYRGKPSIHYYYVKSETQVTIERHPGRKFELGKDCNSHRRCLRIGHSSGDTQLYESCDFEELNYSQVTQNIFLGPYVKTTEDLMLLQQKKVTAILSIQTDQDIASHRLTPYYLSELCDEYGIQLITYSIEDMNKKDFLQKWTGAVILLRNLLHKGNKVYVHCSAGVYRSPQVVALYLMLVNHISPSEAIEFVKKKHPYARPSQHLINSAFEMVTKRQAQLQPQTHI